MLDDFGLDDFGLDDFEPVDKSKPNLLNHFSL